MIPISSVKSSANMLKRDSCHRLFLVPELGIHTSMYGIADKYGIQGLKKISLQKLKAALENYTWNPESRHLYTPNMMKELTMAVHTAWKSTPESDIWMRAALLDHAWRNKKVLLEVEEFKLVIQLTPQFAYDLFAQASTRKSTETLTAEA